MIRLKKFAPRKTKAEIQRKITIDKRKVKVTETVWCFPRLRKLHVFVHVTVEDNF